MNIAYISVQRDQTGYSHAANDMICALSEAGANVSSIWVSLSGTPKPKMDDKIIKLEQNKLDRTDVVIQHILPQYFVRVRDAYNIGFFHYETSHFRGSNWQYSCNLMDEIWVLTAENRAMCKASGVKVPVVVVDQPVDNSKFDRTYTDLFDNLDGRYMFYTISEISYRKGILSLLAAFRTAFTDKDNVGLVIKGFISGADGKTTEEEFDEIIKTVKMGIKKGKAFKSPPIILISEWLSDDQIARLHKTCHCFVSMSRGESLCIPLLEAACFGNKCIGPDWNGPLKILTSVFPQFHCLIPTSAKAVFGQHNTLPNLYYSDEIWHEPSVIDAAEHMRSSYDLWLKHNDHYNKQLKQTANSLKAYYDSKKIGSKILQSLQTRINKHESSVLGIQEDQYQEA